MSGSKIHSVQAAAYDDFRDEEDTTERREEEEAAQRGNDEYLPDPPNPRSSRTDEAAATNIHDASHQPGPLEAVDLSATGPRIHAPWPGLHEVCKGCGAPSVSGLGSGPQTCERCPRHVAPVGGGGGKAGGGDNNNKQQPAAGKAAREVAVTSVREVALIKEHAAVLRWTGTVMLGMSCLLFVLLLTAWRGIDFSLVRDFSPWLGIYVPIPLGLLNGAWSLHCASCGYVRYQGSGSCAARAGFCGTAWGCSGPSCALNLGLDLGLLITATLAALPAGASARGCGYDCYVLLCFPCAPIGGEGMAATMVLASLGLASAAARKMWSTTFAVREGIRVEGFLPW